MRFPPRLDLLPAEPEVVVVYALRTGVRLPIGQRRLREDGCLERCLALLDLNLLPGCNIQCMQQIVVCGVRPLRRPRCGVPCIDAQAEAQMRRPRLRCWAAAAAAEGAAAAAEATAAEEEEGTPGRDVLSSQTSGNSPIRSAIS